MVYTVGSWISAQHTRSIGSPTSITNTWKDLVWSGTNGDGNLFMNILDASNNALIVGSLALASSPYVLSGNTVFNDKNLKVEVTLVSGASFPILYYYDLAYEPNTLGNRAGGLVNSLSGGSFSL